MDVSHKRWTSEETELLLDMWATKDIQNELDGTVRDAEVYRKLAELLRKEGYARSATQVKGRIKVLKRGYRTEKAALLKSGRSGGGIRFRFYKQLDNVFKYRSNTTSSSYDRDTNTPVSDNSEGSVTTEDAELDRSNADELSLLPQSSQSSAEKQSVEFYKQRLKSIRSYIARNRRIKSAITSVKRRECPRNCISPYLEKQRRYIDTKDSSCLENARLEINVKESLSNGVRDGASNEVQLPTDVVIKNEDDGLSFFECLGDINTASTSKETTKKPAEISTDEVQTISCQNSTDPPPISRGTVSQVPAITSTPHVISVTVGTSSANRKSETVSTPKQACQQLKDSSEFESRFMNFFRSFKTRIERLDEDKQNELQIQFMLLLRNIETGKT